jgi:hypothetical protein
VETSEAKVGEIWGLDYYLFILVIPSGSIIERHGLWWVRHRRGAENHVRFSRRAGAELGIPNMISKESAGSPRVKAAIITAQGDGLP